MRRAPRARHGADEVRRLSTSGGELEPSCELRLERGEDRRRVGIAITLPAHDPRRAPATLASRPLALHMEIEVYEIDVLPSKREHLGEPSPVKASSATAIRNGSSA